MTCLKPTAQGVLFTAIAIFSLLITLSMSGQSTRRHIGTSFEVTADQRVLRPSEQPCVVPLFMNFQFAHFSDTAQTFQFTPACSGPWKKVVFQMDFSENGGVQFDRTASLYLGNTNIYFGTTPEPLPVATNTWHIERDITDYSSLLTVPQTGTIVLANCTTDCAPPYNTLNGVFTVNANLQFYPADSQPAQGVADMVLPLVQVNDTGGTNLPALLFLPTDQLSTTFTFPKNVERAYLDVLSQSQSTDEQWYGCFPNDLSDINEVYGCGNTDFRETEITIDGQPAGLAPVSPWVYTGFLPDQWVPSPGVQTLDFVPYRVNLTPFAGMLSNGNPHTVALSVFNDDSYFAETGSLLLFLDKGSSQVTGAVVKNTLTAPSPTVTEDLHGTGTVKGTIGVKSDRSFTIAGYVNTSHGKVSTSIEQHQGFESMQKIDFDTVNGTVLDQKTTVKNKVASVTTVSGNGGSVVTHDDFSFPIDVDFIFPVSSSEFGFNVVTGQNYQIDKKIWHGGSLVRFESVTNSAQASDVSPASSSQRYNTFNSDGNFYDCQISSKKNVLASVSPGCADARH
ncbi:MAG TPA: peptide-N4-asparagine amidase [Candidatus Sulfotelmatobacter sp.]|nr:peptide-N4-asparagine amidase [Candidatus Sulfotelmatobacter sp.]